MSVSSLIALYGAGLASFFSPCVLPLLPAYISILGGSRPSPRGRISLAGIGFAVGLSVVFVTLGMGVSAVAMTLSAYRRTLMIAAGVVMAIFGVKMAGGVRIGALDRDVRPLLGRVPSPGGFSGGFLFGAAFSLGWTPCVGPVLGSVLAYAASRSASPSAAALDLSAYALGLSTPLLAAAAATPRMLAFTHRLRGITPVVERAMGAMLVVVGLLIAFDRVSALAPASSLGRTASGSCEVSGAAACNIDDSAAVPDSATVPTGRPHLLEFMSAHCTVCARMAPLIAALEHECTNDDGTVLRVNVDAPAGRALAQHYAVHAVPTFLELDANGEEVERAIGEQSSSGIKIALETVRGRSCSTM